MRCLSSRAQDGGRYDAVCLCAAALALAGLVSCSSVRQIRPLDVGESAVNVSLGGPITKYIGDAYLPLPLISVGYNYGLMRTFDLEAGFHVMQAVFGIMHFDIGANWRPLQSRAWIPGLIVTPRFHFMTNFEPDAFSFYPDLALTLAWHPKEFFYPYAGIENWFELRTERDDNVEQPHHWLIVPYAGAVLCRGRWQFQVEARAYTPNLRNTGRGPKNIGFGEYGILGVFLGVGRTFGGK
jgi:hypothetical protein